MTVPNDKLFSAYSSGGNPCALAGPVESLFRSQLQTWELLAANHAGLSEVETRVFSCKDGNERYDVATQWNPKRIQSTGAKIDRTAPRARACFLCLENLFPEQKGICYEDRFLILCNPFPIFDRHFTIADIRHVPQLLAGTMASMLSLSRDLGPDYAVFYNGAFCGASAPDHLHLQACPALFLPDRRIAFSNVPDKVVGDTRICVPPGLGRSVVFLLGGDAEALTDVVEQLLSALTRGRGADDEPMINVIVSWRENHWLTAIYPRQRHRPLKFDAPEGERFMVSPGAVDMSGVLVMPIEEEFRRIAAGDIQTIYDDVSMTREDIRRIVQYLPD